MREPVPSAVGFMCVRCPSSVGRRQQIRLGRVHPPGVDVLAEERRFICDQKSFRASGLNAS